MGMGRLSRYIPAAKRKPKPQRSEYTEYTIQSRCRCDIKRHHEMMKDDPERLTTEFMVEITGCNCKRTRGQEKDDLQ